MTISKFLSLSPKFPSHLQIHYILLNPPSYLLISCQNSYVRQTAKNQKKSRNVTRNLLLFYLVHALTRSYLPLRCRFLCYILIVGVVNYSLEYKKKQTKRSARDSSGSDFQFLRVRKFSSPWRFEKCGENEAETKKIWFTRLLDSLNCAPFSFSAFGGFDLIKWKHGRIAKSDYKFIL